ncbi:MAG: ATPase, T2SS/T4P/T4SS family [Dehalococcoidia bacterium]
MKTVSRPHRSSLGDTLVQAQLITEEQWRLIQEMHQQDGRRVEEILHEQGLVSPQQLAFFTSLHLGIPYVNLNRQGVHPEAVDVLPETIARKYGVMPLDLANGTLTVAMQDPGDIEVIEEMAAYSRKLIQPVVGVPQEIQETIDRHYRASGEIEKQLSQIPTQSQRLGSHEQRVSAEAIAHAPVVRAVDLIIRQAVRDRASDIHVEPQEDRLRIRSRIDGMLHEVMSLPLNVHAPLISRIKIMAGMNIAERRRSQDGQITFRVQDREVDIRVATSNTVYGEMSVLRVLDKSFALLTLPELGFLTESLDTYRQMLKTPFGIILIGGPTGSGKTTTQYASVNQLDSVGRNIITIEDPVEYRFANINQMQVNPAAGVTFATGLRSTMRLDPNVILVGEIRDSETAQIAIQAALTGHLVLSSVHANDTVGVILRMIDLGVEPFLAASAIIGVVAQRMVRRVCPHCAQLAPVTSEERVAYEEEMGESRQEFLYGSGCNFCAGTGYLGRTGIYEVMVISESIRRIMMLGGANSDEIRSKAVEDGMISLWHDGMNKVKMGITTPYEVIRNVFSIG